MHVFMFSLVVHVFHSNMLLSDAFSIHLILSRPRLTRPDTTSNPSWMVQDLL